MIQVRVSDTKQAGAHDLATLVSSTLASHTANRKVLLLCSGGSALAVLDAIDWHGIDYRNLAIGLVDERVTVDEQHSNARQLLQKPGIEIALESGASNLIVVPTISESAEFYASRYSQILKEFLSKNHPVHVVTILGIGTDGHTAGVMPAFPDDADEKHQADFAEQFDQVFLDPEILVAGYDASAASSHPKRATVTLACLKKYTDEAFIFAFGDNKHQILRAILGNPETSLERYPAAILHHLPSVIVATDMPE